MIQLHILFHIFFHYGLSQDIEYSSMCYIVGSSFFLCCFTPIFFPKESV